MIFYALAVLTFVLAVSTLLPLSKYAAWWVRDLDFPRLQLAMALTALLAGSILLLVFSEPRAWILIGVTTACLLYQGWWILPHTRIYRHEVKWALAGDPENTIRLMNANVLTPSHAADALLKLVRENNPDVLVTLETDKWWEQELAVLERDYPHTIKCALDNLYGMHVYSRFPLRNAAIQFLVEPDIPSMHAELILPSGQSVRMHFLHPAPPSPTENETSGERDAELMIVGKSVSESDTPVIVAGDLNDVAWSETTRLFRKISGLLDPRVGRGMYNTFNARHWYARWPLDHIFHSRHFTVSSLQRLPDFGSDHFALLSVLVCEKERSAEQKSLEADADDHAEADEKAAEHSVDEFKVHEPDR